LILSLSLSLEGLTMVVHSHIVDGHLVEFIREDLSFNRLANIVKEGNVHELKRLSSRHMEALNSSQDEAGHNLLHIASIYGQADCMHFLIRNGMNLNQEDSFNGDTPLHRAMQGGHLECGSLLLRNGAQVNSKDKMGLTPLHEAMEGGHFKCVDLLVSYGAELDAKDAEGLTPLHAGASKECKKSYVSLLRHGADDSIEAGEEDEDEQVSAKDMAIEAWGQEWYEEVEKTLRMQKELKECVPLLTSVLCEEDGHDAAFNVFDVEDSLHVFSQQVLPFLYEFHSCYL